MRAQSSEHPIKPLFYPKVLPHEVRLMLSSHDALGGAGLFCGWKQAKVSKDFWIETASEFIRVHVVPGNTTFSPSTWQTKLVELKDVLLKRLEGERTTEVVLCLAEGTGVTAKHDVSFIEGMFLKSPWIGRSSVPKIKLASCCATATAEGPPSIVDARPCDLAMEHEEEPAAVKE